MVCALSGCVCVFVCICNRYVFCMPCYIPSGSVCTHRFTVRMYVCLLCTGSPVGGKAASG